MKSQTPQKIVHTIFKEYDPGLPLPSKGGLRKWANKCRLLSRDLIKSVTFSMDDLVDKELNLLWNLNVQES